jgi:NAD(P)-dependent dehydrogenase (short-subunit alcohol dehydrogenase family)
LKPAEKRKSLSLLFFRKEDSFLPCRARFDIAPPARAYGPGTDRKDIGMIIDMKGRKAIVTGSTAGIGRATAEGLARAGAAVVDSGRGSDRVDAAIRQMRQDFPAADISGVAADLSTAEGAEAVFAQAPDADILVNNVGTAVLRNFADTTDEDWQSIFQINFFSGVRMTRHYLPGMVERGWGRVVFVSSESGVNIPKEMIDYGVTKTAQLALSRGLAEASAGTGVTVNAVLPGPTRSEILGNWMAAQAKDNGITQAQAEQAFLTSARPTSLIQRFATTDEVANMIVYLCSEQASATTGAALRVDGGVVRFVA